MKLTQSTVNKNKTCGRAKLAYAFEYFVVGENLALEKSRATAGPLKAFRGRPGWKSGFLLFLASTSVEIFF